MDAPFDRGEVDRASLDATERLRARLSGQRPAPVEPSRRPILPWVIAGSLFVFTAGMVANPWFESNIRSRLPFTTAAHTNPAEIKAVEGRLTELETRAEPDGTPMPAERLARTEAKIETSSDQIARESDRVDRLTSDVAALGATLQADRTRVESATATATTAAERAQAMLVLVLARNAIETGRPFGALDPLLRQSFEQRYPAAVKSVSALGSAPVTLATLRRDFDAMRPALGLRPAGENRLSWWETLTTKLSSAVESAPAELTPLAAAQAALQRGDAQAAANQLRRLPNRPAALTAWLAAAERQQTGTQALATLENAVLLAPAIAPPPPPVTVPAIAPPPTTNLPATTPTPPAQKRIAHSPGIAQIITNTLRRTFAWREIV